MSGFLMDDRRSLPSILYGASLGKKSFKLEPRLESFEEDSQYLIKRSR